MDWVVIEGVKPYDGRYPFDLEESPLTTREWGWIKRLSGYLPLTLDDGFSGGDPELFSCFAAIALRRAGVVDTRQVAEVFDRIVDNPFETTIRMESDAPAEEEPEGDASPPPPSSSASGPDSGPSLTNGSGDSDEIPGRSGMPESATSESPPTRSGS
jgi:hypothetical protein